MSNEFMQWYNKTYPNDAFESIGERNEHRRISWSGWSAAVQLAKIP